MFAIKAEELVFISLFTPSQPRLMDSQELFYKFLDDCNELTPSDREEITYSHRSSDDVDVPRATFSTPDVSDFPFGANSNGFQGDPPSPASTPEALRLFIDEQRAHRDDTILSAGTVYHGAEWEEERRKEIDTVVRALTQCHTSPSYAERTQLPDPASFPTADQVIIEMHLVEPQAGDDEDPPPKPTMVQDAPCEEIDSDWALDDTATGNTQPVEDNVVVIDRTQEAADAIRAMAEFTDSQFATPFDSTEQPSGQPVVSSCMDFVSPPNAPVDTTVCPVAPGRAANVAFGFGVLSTGQHPHVIIKDSEEEDDDIEDSDSDDDSQFLTGGISAEGLDLVKYGVNTSRLRIHRRVARAAIDPCTDYNGGIRKPFIRDPKKFNSAFANSLNALARKASARETARAELNIYTKVDPIGGINFMTAVLSDLFAEDDYPYGEMDKFMQHVMISMLDNMSGVHLRLVLDRMMRTSEHQSHRMWLQAAHQYITNNPQQMRDSVSFQAVDLSRYCHYVQTNGALNAPPLLNSRRIPGQMRCDSDAS